MEPVPERAIAEEVDQYATLTRRYGVEPEALRKVLVPLLLPISQLEKSTYRVAGQGHWRASFETPITDESNEILVPGRTGKFVPGTHMHGGAWREIAKGRILHVDEDRKIASGEIYTGKNSRSALEAALVDLDESALLEIDPYGAGAKILSSLAESELALQLRREGFDVHRMPEDTAQHVGNYANFDFLVRKEGVEKKLEEKSLWGTDTSYARLIHSKGRDYPTSSCKFSTQDFFAVSLFLRTGDLKDFAFARSVSEEAASYGLPVATGFPEHVNQNPKCQVGDGVWFGTLEEVWDLP